MAARLRGTRRQWQSVSFEEKPGEKGQGRDKQRRGAYGSTPRRPNAARAQSPCRPPSRPISAGVTWAQPIKHTGRADRRAGPGSVCLPSKRAGLAAAALNAEGTNMLACGPEGATPTETAQGSRLLARQRCGGATRPAH